MQNISKKCKNCGGELNFDIESNELKCAYCGSIVEVPETKSNNKKYPYDESMSRLQQADFMQYKCTSCGCIHNAYTDHMSICPSCGSRELVNISKVGLMPDNIVPFQITKEAALKIFANWINSRQFAPNDLKRMVKDRKITAFYIPVWNFKYTSCCQYTARVVEERNGDRRVRTKSGSFYNNADDRFISANGFYSSTIVELDQISALRYMCEYREEFLYGFNSSEQNIPINTAYKRLEEKVSSENRSKARSMAEKYGEVEYIETTTTLSDVSYNYIYIPMYVNHYRYKNKHYKCYITGTGGKVTGKSPKSFWKIFALVASVLIGIAVIAGVVISLL